MKEEDGKGRLCSLSVVLHDRKQFAEKPVKLSDTHVQLQVETTLTK
jgi:hypothetical protein